MMINRKPKQFNSYRFRQPLCCRFVIGAPDGHTMIILTIKGYNDMVPDGHTHTTTTTTTTFALSFPNKLIFTSKDSSGYTFR